MEDKKSIRRLGKMLAEARANKGYSARELAEKVGAHHSTITMLEKGVIEQPRTDKLTKLARELDLDPTDLLTLAGYNPTDKLPAFSVYLRSTSQLPDQAIDELEGHFQYLRDKYGAKEARPADGEDE